MTGISGTPPRSGPIHGHCQAPARRSNIHAVLQRTPADRWAGRTAREQGLVGCRACHALAPISEEGHPCPRCGARLQSRLPRSVSRTWALLLAAMVLYVPANVLPVMNVVMLGRGQPDTILGGVLHLLEAGMWPLAAIVFVASIVVPVLKLAVLSFLLVSVQAGSRWRPLDRARVFRLTEFVGRWSMVDIFVIAILAALVQFGSLARIDAGPGSLSFAAVVVLTMFAANTFDPRLIWDAATTRTDVHPAHA